MDEKCSISSSSHVFFFLSKCIINDLILELNMTNQSELVYLLNLSALDWNQ